MKWNEIIKEGHEPTEEECLEAVSQNPWSIREMRNPSEKVRIKAVEENPRVLEAIQDQTEEICLVVLRNEYTAAACYKLINIPFTERMKEALLESSPRTAYQNRETLGLRFDPEEKENLFRLMSSCPEVYTDEIPSGVMRGFLERDGTILRGYETDSVELMWAAIRNNPKAICFVKPTPDMIRYALGKNDSCLMCLTYSCHSCFIFSEEYLFIALAAETKELTAKEILEIYKEHGELTDSIFREVLRQRINDPCDWLGYFQRFITPEVIDRIIEQGNPENIIRYIPNDSFLTKTRLKNLFRKVPNDISIFPEKYLSCSMFFVAAKSDPSSMSRGYYVSWRFNFMKWLCRHLYKKKTTKE